MTENVKATGPNFDNCKPEFYFACFAHARRLAGRTGTEGQIRKAEK